ncbi:efflux RND transporter periplasmic adaptor subunit [Marivita hallyeonensis]|uniref:Membrane fusion protein, multidrug efflux system n=1 Tax=Marivita hallyeonensis TaxID=996342 RepID=A0A1M5VGV9_9RHOB|nr:efflux RND transporter periplasmic adaptor subunit [Marivita hallyeonensis]SHH74522.1 membrane fusion protein, multidrug efflux system [Marivita hallyeonensis]
MRIVPIITAVLVAVLLFGIVIERDRLFAIVRDLSPREEAVEEAVSEETVEAIAPEAAEDDLPEGVVRVMATRSVAQEIETQVRLRGETEAAREVSVLSETSGKVISEPLRKGAFVQEDQLMCALDPGTSEASLAEAEARLAEAIARRPEIEARIPEAQARLVEAEARLQEANINARAAMRLSEGGFASQTRVANTEASVQSAQAAIVSAEAGVKAAEAGLDGLTATVETAQAAVARAETEIERLEIRAPFAGLLETDTAELGTLLQPGALCATIIQLDPIKVVGFVPEAEVNRVEVGARAGARLSNQDDVMARVTFLSRSADPTTRTFRVELTVPNPELSLRDGQTAEILIEAQGVMAHILPASVLTLNDEGTLGVRTIDAESQALFMPVTVLRDAPKGIYVSGLPDQVDVITVGQEFVTDGVAVAPSFEEVIQ